MTGSAEKRAKILQELEDREKLRLLRARVRARAAAGGDYEKAFANEMQGRLMEGRAAAALCVLAEREIIGRIVRILNNDAILARRWILAHKNDLNFALEQAEEFWGSVADLKKGMNEAYRVVEKADGVKIPVDEVRRGAELARAIERAVSLAQVNAKTEKIIRNELKSADAATLKRVAKLLES